MRRTGQLAEAAGELQTALAGAKTAGLIEEEWKALYSLGRVREGEGRIDDARQSFEQAIAVIESVRSDLGTTALRSEFLADKRKYALCSAAVPLFIASAYCAPVSCANRRSNSAIGPSPLAAAFT